jgi:hypothetical protein
MFRSYGHLQAENILLARIIQLSNPSNISSVSSKLTYDSDVIDGYNNTHYLISHTQQDANTRD